MAGDGGICFWGSVMSRLSLMFVRDLSFGAANLLMKFRKGTDFLNS